MGLKIGYNLVSNILLLWLCKLCVAQRIFNIMQFGAVPGGKVDNSKALSTAWNQACGFNGGAEVLIPKGTFLVLPLILQGPCKGRVQLQIDGVLEAPTGVAFASGDHWLAIENVNNLVVDGFGILDGQGASAWSLPCHDGQKCSRPANVRFHRLNSATVRNVKSVNSKFFHFVVLDSQSVTFDHVSVVAPGDSPNTDGIHISMSTDIHITNSIIATGDDCISLGPGSRTINITSVQCGPGHGISIGSLGQNPNEADVTGVTVQHSSFFGTQNGVRIKSWSSPNRGLVNDVTFSDIQMKHVENPIIIDQNYCPHDACKKILASMSRVQIRNVRYQGIRGTSSTKVAVAFDCSQVAPCQGIVLHDINLAFSGGGQTTSTCSNVKGSTSGQELPPSCI